MDPSPTYIELKNIQIPDPDGNTSEEVDRLRQIIWIKRHLLMGKGNALPPATRGTICDIDVVHAWLIAQRERTAYLRRGTSMPRMDLLSPCVPVGWRVALLGRLGEDVDVGLDRGRPGGP